MWKINGIINFAKKALPIVIRVGVWWMSSCLGQKLAKHKLFVVMDGCPMIVGIYTPAATILFLVIYIIFRFHF